jgi:IMP dehydrogenase
MKDKIIGEGITFDDVLLVPARSQVNPAHVDLSTRLTRTISLNIPLVSAPMDTVTEASLAIALAQEGGIGIMHRNLPTEAQAREVEKVKRSENGIIVDPITLTPAESTATARALMAERSVSGFPIVDGAGKVVGILTRRDMKFLSQDRPIGEVMTREKLVTAPPNTSLDKAQQILNQAKVEKLLLVDGEGKLAGMITMRDIDKLRQSPRSCKDPRGRLRVGAAVGVMDFERVDALIAAGVDVIVIDTSHGHKEIVLESIRQIKSAHEIDVIAGNIATGQAAADLIAAGADGLRVGIGPGSICTTRVVSGVGVPQITAIRECAKVGDQHGVPVIADGGIRHSGDITKALAAGACCVMLGNLFAGLDESPGELIIYKGRRHAGRLGRPLQPGRHRRPQEPRARGRRRPRALPRLLSGFRVPAFRRHPQRHGPLRHGHHRAAPRGGPLPAHLQRHAGGKPPARHRHHPRAAELFAGDQGGRVMVAQAVRLGCMPRVNRAMKSMVCGFDTL